MPDQSQVLIDARSSLHPIHTRTDGLDGHLDMEVLGGGRVNLHSQPFAKLSFPVNKLSSGNPLEDRELKRRIDSRRYPTIEGKPVLSCVRPAKTVAMWLVVISRSAV